MIQRTFHGLNVSGLGMGCMRLPVTEAEGHPIDRPKAIELIRHAIDCAKTLDLVSPGDLVVISAGNASNWAAASIFATSSRSGRQ